MSTLSARALNHDVSAAKRAADHEPVIITDRGRATHVLLSIADYERISGPRRDLSEWLQMPDDDIAFEPEKVDIALKVPDL